MTIAPSQVEPVHCDPTKRALVLSGGGAKGAFQVGALQHLLGDRQEQYQLLVGISVGAINAAYLAQHPLGEERQSTESLMALWRGLRGNGDVYRNWRPFGPLHALWKPSWYNTQPLMELLCRDLDPKRMRTSGRCLRVGAVSLDTGELRHWTEQSEDIIQAVMASSAFPAVFRPVELQGELYVDGGVREIAPIKAAIEHGASSVDVILALPPVPPPYRRRRPNNALRVALRAMEIMSDEVIRNDIRTARLINQLVDAGVSQKHEFLSIRIIQPAPEAAADDSFDFSPASIERRIKAGYEMACEACGPLPSNS